MKKLKLFSNQSGGKDENVNFNYDAPEQSLIV